MKVTAALLVIATVGCVIFLTGCGKNAVQANVDNAIAQEEYQFIALLDADGKWTYPQVPEIPDWYFKTTGILIRQTQPETFAKDVAYMKSYNDALYKTLKAQGKFHAIEENIARVKENLEKSQAATNSTALKK